MKSSTACHENGKIIRRGLTLSEGVVALRIQVSSAVKAGIVVPLGLAFATDVPLARWLAWVVIVTVAFARDKVFYEFIPAAAVRRWTSTINFKGLNSDIDWLTSMGRRQQHEDSDKHVPLPAHTSTAPRHTA